MCPFTCWEKMRFNYELDCAIAEAKLKSKKVVLDRDTLFELEDTDE